MTTTSGNTKTPDNNQLASQYVSKMKADLATIQADIAKLQNLLPAQADAAQELALMKMLEKMGFADPDDVKAAQDAFNTAKKAVTDVEDELNKLDPGLASFDTAIQALENGYEQIANGDVAHVNDYDTYDFSNGNIFDPTVVHHKGDLTILRDTLNSIGAAMADKMQCDTWRDKLKADGNDDNALSNDCVQAMKFSVAENGVIDQMESDLGADMVDINQAKNDAQTDLDSYHWWDDALSCGTDESDKERDRAIIRNYYVMKAIVASVESAVAPEKAAAENEVFATAELSMEKLVDKMKKILSLPNMSVAEKASKIKCLMALALGILAQVQSAAATLKAQNNAMEKKGAIYAQEMNTSNEKAQLDQLREELSYAKTMGTLMKIAKPMLEVGGTLLAPGVGSFVVMALLMIADNAGLTDKLTAQVAKIPGMTALGAQILVGGLEMIATMGGGAVLDGALKDAAVVAAKVGQETAVAVAKAVEETVTKVVTTVEADLGRALTVAEKDAVTKVVTQGVEKAVQNAATKAVVMFNKQASATLIPQLLKAGVKEGTASLTKMLAVAAEDSVAAAVKAAAKTAGEDIEFFASAAAKGADVTPAMIDDAANSAANKAVAKVADTTPEKVANATEKSAASKAFSRGASTAAYVALSDGAVSSLTEYELKKHGVSKDSDEFQRIMETIKILESIMASMAMMYGTGVADSVIMGGGSATNLMTAGTAASLIGTAGQTIGQAGQADAEMKQADTVQAINESTVSNEMLNMFMQQFNSQGKIDEKNLENEMAEQASNYTMISQLENSGKEAAQVLSQSAV